MLYFYDEYPFQTQGDRHDKHHKKDHWDCWEKDHCKKDKKDHCWEKDHHKKDHINIINKIIIINKPSAKSKSKYIKIIKKWDKKKH